MSDFIENSLNPYGSLDVISARSPDELVVKLRSIKTPYKILAFTVHGNRHHAYIQGDHRIVKKVRKKKATAKKG